MAYDVTLTMSREVDCIWLRKISFATVLYVFQRYTTLLQHAIDTVFSLWVPGSVEVCPSSYPHGETNILPQRSMIICGRLPRARCTNLSPLDQLSLGHYHLCNHYYTWTCIICRYYCLGNSLPLPKPELRPAAVASFRVWAICGQRWLPFIVVAIPSSLVPAINIVRIYYAFDNVLTVI